jgi:hypothetical protein
MQWPGPKRPTTTATFYTATVKQPSFSDAHYLHNVNKPVAPISCARAGKQLASPPSGPVLSQHVDHWPKVALSLCVNATTIATDEARHCHKGEARKRRPFLPLENWLRFAGRRLA